MKLLLFTNRKLNRAFDWYRNRWRWMAQWALSCVFRSQLRRSNWSCTHTVCDKNV